MEAHLEQDIVNFKFMDYIATSLQLAPQNKYITRSFLNAIDFKSGNVDKRTVDEIAQDVIKQAGLSFEGAE